MEESYNEYISYFEELTVYLSWVTLIAQERIIILL